MKREKKKVVSGSINHLFRLLVRIYNGLAASAALTAKIFEMKINWKWRKLYVLFFRGEAERKRNTRNL